MNGAKNLILGFCARQPFRSLAPFIATLRRVGYAGDVWLLVEDTSTDTVARLREYGVIVERAARSAQPGMAAMSSRYFSYLDVLSRAGDGYDHVLLADPATTVFQADPFAAPLPADIVFTSEGRHIGDTPAVYEAVVRAYGEAVAHNIRHCVVAESGTTIATRSGMLRYLAAMTRQFGGRTTPITGAFDLGVHNYVVHMHRLRDAWLDPANRIVATLHAVPDEALAITDDAVLVGGAATPVLTRCDANARMVQQLRTAPRFRPDEPVPIVAAPGPRDAVVAYYHRERDEGWLHLFFGSLRGIGETIAAHCIGDFNEAELAILRRYGCVPHVVPPSDLGIAENVAHFYISQALDGMEAEAVPLGQVLVLDSVRALFLRDPFLTGMTGLSVFAEGPTRIGDSDYNRDRLGFFVQPIEPLLENPVVSSMAMRGELPVLRAFYRRMFNELVARAELLQIHKVVQGAVNKICHGGGLEFPVTVHPNGSEVYFEFLEPGLAVDMRHGIRFGGAVPALVLSGHPETPLMIRLRIDLGLADD